MDTAYPVTRLLSIATRCHGRFKSVRIVAGEPPEASLRQENLQPPLRQHRFSRTPYVDTPRHRGSLRLYGSIFRQQLKCRCITGTPRTGTRPRRQARSFTEERPCPAEDPYIHCGRGGSGQGCQYLCQYLQLFKGTVDTFRRVRMGRVRRATCLEALHPLHHQQGAASCRRRKTLQQKVL